MARPEWRRGAGGGLQLGAAVFREECGLPISSAREGGLVSTPAPGSVAAGGPAHGVLVAGPAGPGRSLGGGGIGGNLFLPTWLPYFNMASFGLLPVVHRVGRILTPSEPQPQEGHFESGPPHHGTLEPALPSPPPQSCLKSHTSPYTLGAWGLCPQELKKIQKQRQDFQCFPL